MPQKQSSLDLESHFPQPKKNNNSQPISAISSLTSSEKAAGGTGVVVSTAVAGGTGVVVSTAVVLLPLESKYSSNDVQDARSSQIRLCQSTGSIPGVAKPTNKNPRKMRDSTHNSCKKRFSRQSWIQLQARLSRER